MSEQLITVGEATQKLGVTSDLPANKCLTKAEFDELVAQIPELAPNGVYIMHKDRFLVKKENWTFYSQDASGVAVKTDNCAFVIAKEEFTQLKWGGYGVLINGCTTVEDFDVAKSDYRGSKNTDAIVSQLGTGSEYAARKCSEYVFLHGVNGYLPALGELYEVYQNKSEVDECMSLIGGASLQGESSDKQDWSSTQFEENQAFGFQWDNGEVFGVNKIMSNRCTRPFAAFK